MNELATLEFPIEGDVKSARGLLGALKYPHAAGQALLANPNPYCSPQNTTGNQPRHFIMYAHAMLCLCSTVRLPLLGG